MTGFAEIVQRLAPDGAGFVIDAPEEWAQGRTLFGGITAALAYRTAWLSHAALPPLRSAQFAFVGPAAGRLRFVSTLLRQGRSATIVAVDGLNDDGVAARATFVFAAPRESVVAHDRAPRPDVPPPEVCAPFHKSTKPLPGFLGRFEFRLAAGARLFQPEEAPEFAVWARLRDGDGDDPVAALLAYGDCLPGAAMAAFPRPAPISTMTWAIDLHQPLPASTGWHLIRSSSDYAADGYSLQDMRIFARDGTPLATARQLVALFA